MKVQKCSKNPLHEDEAITARDRIEEETDAKILEVTEREYELDSDEDYLKYLEGIHVDAIPCHACDYWHLVDIGKSNYHGL
jgi:hypothetical protein